MEKFKIRDIASELNTSGARIKEVLAELGIEVKSVASSITEDERKKLYVHFGLNEDGSTKEKDAAVSSVKREARQKGVVIVRRTEVHSKNPEEDNSNGKNARKNYIVSDDASGLMSGLSHESGPRLQKKKSKAAEPAKKEAEATNSAVATPAGPILLKKKTKPAPEKVEETEKTEKVEEAPTPVQEVKEEPVVEVAKDDVKVEEVAEKVEKTETVEPVVNETAEVKEEPVVEEKVEPKKDHSEGRFDKKHAQEDNKNSKNNSRRNDNSRNDNSRNDNNRNGKDKQNFRNNRNNNNNKSRDIEIPKADFSTQKEEPSRSADSQKISREKELAKNNLKDQKREGLSTKQNNAQNKNKKKNKNVEYRGKNTSVHDIVNDDDMLDKWYDGNTYRKKRKNKQEEKKYVPPKQTVTSISIPDSISVKELAEALKKTAAEVIKKLMSLGVMATLNSEIDYDTAALITEEFGVIPEKLVVVSEEDLLFDDDEDEDESNLVPRDPVVVVMGHVDHGKTSLLDAIRNANVIEGEAGGITQHIGAYKVKINDRYICFLDTPGHEAFTAMRARGAQATDIAVLVVAADDGVMPQTVEAINHARAAGVKLVVAINKIDREGANPERVKQELTEHNVIPTAWGGDTEFVEVSAKQRLNIDELLEIILLEADMLELKADPNKQAKGTVIEARLDKSRGAVASLLVQRGTLKTGDTIITGTAMGRIRAMINDKGKKIKAAGPSTPVEITGLSEVPEAGEIFYAITDEKMARHLAEKRRAKIREEQLKSTSKVTLEDLFKQIQEGTVKDLNIIVKADVQGSVEAVTQSLEKLSNDEVRVKVIHGAVGAVSESDVTLAQVSGAIIIGFNVRPGNNVTEAAELAGVDMRMYRVIYNAIEDVEAAIKGMLDPTYKEVVLGHAEIRQLYKVSGVGTIGGCYVTDGVIRRNAEVRVVRGGIVVNEGKLASLKRFKDDAREVSSGFECGLMIERFNDIKEGDVVEAFVMEEVER